MSEYVVIIDYFLGLIGLIFLSFAIVSIIIVITAYIYQRIQENKSNHKVSYNNCGNCTHSFFERLLQFSDHRIKMTYDEFVKQCRRYDV